MGVTCSTQLCISGDLTFRSGQEHNQVHVYFSLSLHVGRRCGLSGPNFSETESSFSFDRELSISISRLPSKKTSDRSLFPLTLCDSFRSVTARRRETKCIVFPSYKTTNPFQAGPAPKDSKWRFFLDRASGTVIAPLLTILYYRLGASKLLKRKIEPTMSRGAKKRLGSWLALGVLQWLLYSFLGNDVWSMISFSRRCMLDPPTTDACPRIPRPIIKSAITIFPHDYGDNLIIPERGNKLSRSLGTLLAPTRSERRWWPGMSLFPGRESYN